MFMRAMMVLFGLVFVTAGMLVIYFISIDPMLTWQAAQDWTPTPCTIVSSEVGQYSSDDGYTYSVEISYRYKFEADEFTSDRYSISTGSSSGRSGKQEVVDGYPPGSEHTCYVNPSDPSEALLTRDFQWDTLFGLFGLLFIVPGIIVALAGVYMGGDSKFEQKRQHLQQRFRGMVSQAPADDVRTLPAYDPSEGPRDLKGSSPGAAFALAVFVALFWNGITWTIVLVSWEDGPPSMLGCFLIPFVLIGLLLLAGAVQAFLTLFNPRPLLHVSAEAIRIGDRLRIDWRFQGRTSSIQQLQIKLVGTEHATFRQGTSTSSRDATFLDQVLFDGSGSHRIRTGTCHVQIPDLVPSFEGGSNAIRYVIAVHGDIRWWPDVKSDFPIVILPHDYPRGGV